MKKKITAFFALTLFASGSISQVENYEILYPSTIGLTMTSGDICTSPFSIEEVHQTTIGNTWGCTWTSIHPGIPTSMYIEIMFSVSDGSGPHPTTLNGVANNTVTSGPVVNCAAGTLLTWNLDPASYNPMGTNTFLVDFASSPNNNQVDNLNESDPYIRVVVTYPTCISPTVTLNTFSNVTCSGGSDGAIDLDVSGGTPSYTYDWDNDGTGDNDDPEDLTGLSAGTYNVTVTDNVGCTTVFFYEVTEPAALDLSVTQNGADLMANATSVMYQWINCATMSPVTSATNASFTAASNGDYAVIITDGPCSDTSACYTVSGLGTEDNQPNHLMQVFPNPANNQLNIQLKNNSDSGVISILDMNGKIVLNQSLNSFQGETVSIAISDLEPGMYLLQLVFENEMETVLIAVAR